MATFHPCENTLAEFASGNLDWALAICVSAHLEHCEECRAHVEKLNALGGAFLDQAPSVVSEQPKTSFESLMSKIKQIEAAEPKPENTVAPAPILSAKASKLPKAVRKLLPKDKLQWKMLSPSLKEAHLVTGQDKYQVSFHKIKRGGKVAHHDHRGLEVTIVLEGCFSDEGGTYHVGDYLVKEPGEKHRPMATQNADCLCLSVVEAPVKLTGVVGKLLNPFLTINPA